MDNPDKEQMSVLTVLAIAGSDSSGGAGIGVDLKTFQHFGLHGTMAITALTAQNSIELRAIHPIPTGMVKAQLRSVFEDYEIAAVKIGMMPTVETIESVALMLSEVECGPIVLDTPLSSSTGVQLVESGVAGALVDILFPLTDLITPNLDEAAFFLGEPVAHTVEEMARQGRALAKLSGGSVLVKGGHGIGDQAIDVLINGQMAHQLAARRFETSNNRGTGCALSSAIASKLALGASLYDAVWGAKKWLTEILVSSAGFSIVKGSGPLKFP